MQQYIIKRILMVIPVMLGLSIIVFAMIHMVPGDVARLYLPSDATQDQILALRQQLGLDKPVHIQYVEWLGRVLQGDFGKSYFSKRPVSEEIGRRIPVSAELAALALAVSLTIAIPVGVISAIRQDTLWDYAGRLISILGLAVPNFWMGIMLVTIPSLLFAYSPPTMFIDFFDDPATNLQQMIFPAIALGAAMSAVVMRMTRSSMLEVLRQDYVRTAWAKGLRERVVVVRHALKNALIPVITIVGMQVGTLIGGTVIMEQIFALPGLGRLMLGAIGRRDYYVVQADILFLATVFVMVNLIVDLLYAWLDPRIRYQ